jgi:hypothetical protein
VCFRPREESADRDNSILSCVDSEGSPPLANDHTRVLVFGGSVRPEPRCNNAHRERGSKVAAPFFATAPSPCATAESLHLGSALGPSVAASRRDGCVVVSPSCVGNYSPRRTSPRVLEPTPTERLKQTRLPEAVAVPRSAAGSGKQIPRDGGLGHLEGGIKAMADHLHADLDEFLLQSRQRPIFDRFGRRHCAQKVAEIVGQHMKLKANRVGRERAT